jgi:hypothetical protein
MEPLGVSGPSWFDFPFLKQRQLLPEEEILGCKRGETGPQQR